MTDDNDREQELFDAFYLEGDDERDKEWWLDTAVAFFAYGIIGFAAFYMFWQMFLRPLGDG